MVSAEFTPLLNVYMSDQISEYQMQNNCFYYHVTNTIIDYELPMKPGLEIIEYCLRPLNEPPTEKSHFSSNVTIWTFDKLREKQITSNELYTWSAPIDTIERYQDYLNNPSATISTQVFYNCTSQFFGQYCEYSFQWNISFAQIVASIFQRKPYVANKAANFPCYVYLPTCSFNQLTICLDWREICDRKLNCENGVDEYNCFSLEFNTCSDSEFQCQNGQCIPIELYHDDPLNPDCLDGTDEERDIKFYDNQCSLDPAFRCEERGVAWYFVCGDRSRSRFSGSALLPSADHQRLNRRSTVLRTKMLSHIESGILSFECRKVMTAFLYPEKYRIEDITLDKWIDEVEENCDPIFLFPSLSIAFGHVFFMYTSNKTYNTQNRGQPRYVCFNVLYCPFIKSTIEINGSTCISFLSLNLNGSSVSEAITNIFRPCSLPDERKQCNNSEIMYQCKESLNCISTRRLADGVEDCYGGDDENANFTCSLKDKIRIPCPLGDKCVSHVIADTIVAQCLFGVGNEYFINTPRRLSFPTMCDGFIDVNLHKVVDALYPNSTELEPETDETHCEEWCCNNIYTRCDGFWNCVNGVDELNCPLLNSCAPDRFECLSPETFNITCLPASKAGDNRMDCLGGTDERIFCQNIHASMFSPLVRYQCWNSSVCILLQNLCDVRRDCPFGDDEKLCHQLNYAREMCNRVPTSTEKLLCGFIESEKTRRKIHFSLTEKFSTDLQPQLTTKSNNQHVSMNSILNGREVWLCNRGVPLFFDQRELTDGNIQCLCPASYYGDRCQFQAQRVDISFRLRTLDFRVVFEFVIMLIDSTFQIHSHAQRELLLMRDCDLRIDITLLYSQRPKNDSVSYIIRIDMFEKLTLRFRASWLFPIKTLVLPVYRISTILSLLSEVMTVAECHTFGCVNGDCVSTINTGESFCRCFEGWSGMSCEKWIGYCNCAPNSMCVGSSINRSICVCPLGAFGSRCFLIRSSCQPNPCMNGGICVPTDVRISEYGFTCLCQEGFSSAQCQYRQPQIELSFSNANSVPLSIFVHLITVVSDSVPLRVTILKNIAYDQDSITISIPDEFHLAYIEINKSYYLVVYQTDYMASKHYKAFIQESNRCPPVDELLNSTIMMFETLHRIKYYQRPCRERLALQCFHDKEYMCLCNNERYTNCFLFNHTMMYTCQVSDYCRNGAQCFQNNPTCPSSLLCKCAECFYGSKCQFKTEGMSLSLDAILAYQIRPGVGISQQSRAVKVSLVMVTVLSVLGLVSNTFSVNVFQQKKCLKVGCGLYLLCSSIVSLFITITFALKFTFLLLIQTGTITNRLFLTINCMVVDTLLTILVSVGDWLYACVAVERGVMVTKDIRFDKARSTKMAKWIILLLFVFVIATNLHSLLYRQLIDEEEEKRIWCIVSYSSTVQTLERTKNLLHFVPPFGINIISAVVIIITGARKRSKTRQQNTYQQQLYEQFRHHKHLIISPVMLVILALSRLILTSISGCMRSARDPWLFLIGYLISFVPSFLTFFVFVLPSKNYKKQFVESIKRMKDIVKHILY